MVRSEVNDRGGEEGPGRPEFLRMFELEVPSEGVLYEVVRVNVGWRCNTCDSVKVGIHRVEPAVVVAVGPEAFSWLGTHLTYRDTARAGFVTSPCQLVAEHTQHLIG